MTGYWPTYFFCAFMNRNVENEQGQHPPIFTVQAWPIKEIFSCGTRRVVPSGQDGAILSTWAANHSTEFHSSCQFAELAV